MPTTYYFQQDATGANNGTSLADAWTDLQTAIDTVTAGNTLKLCKRIDGGVTTIAAKVDFDTKSGLTTGYLSYIGCNSAGVDDGTKFIVDGANVALYGFHVVATAAGYLHFKNIDIKRCTSNAFHCSGGTSIDNLFENCSAYNNGGSGWIGFGNRTAWIRCASHNNSLNGFTPGGNSALIECIAYTNGTGGFISTTGAMMVYLYCVAYNNGTTTAHNGFSVYGLGCAVMHCIADANAGIGFSCGQYSVRVMFCRATNNGSYGITLAANSYEDYNYSNNNANTDIYSSTTYVTGGHSLTDGTDGYASRLTGDFDLIPTATLRRTLVALPDSSLTDLAVTAGIPGADYTLPSITGLNILAVDLAGAVEITITGLGLTGFSAATVGGTACTGITAVSDTSAKCTVPVKAAGTYNLIITTTYGTFTLNKALVYGDKSKVLTGTSIDNIIGTSDKLYSDAEETARNVGVAADKILVGNSIKIKNVDTAGSFDEAARNKFNAGTTVADLREGKSVKIQNVDQAGTLPQNKIAPSSGGTMDLPAITSVDPLDTLETIPGEMDVPAIANVRNNDTLRGATGGFDAEAWEALRNTLTANGEADVRESETWKYRGTTKTGTLPFQGSDSLIASEDDEELSLTAD
jgi:hypothetical protein